MKSVFDPDLFYISEAKLWDDVTRTRYLNRIIEVLSFLKEFQIANVNFTPSTLSKLMAENYFNDLHRIEKMNTGDIIFGELIKYVKNVLEIDFDYFRIKHTLLTGDFKELTDELVNILHKSGKNGYPIALWLGINNLFVADEENDLIVCSCHDTISQPILLNDPADYLKQIDINTYWPNGSKSDKHHFKKAIDIQLKIINKKTVYPNVLFRNAFLKDLAKEYDIELRNLILKNISIRLSMRNDEAQLNESLHDHPWKGGPSNKKLRRFHVKARERYIWYEQNTRENILSFESYGTQHY